MVWLKRIRPSQSPIRLGISTGAFIVRGNSRYSRGKSQSSFNSLSTSRSEACPRTPASNPVASASRSKPRRCLRHPVSQTSGVSDITRYSQFLSRVRLIPQQPDGKLRDNLESNPHANGCERLPRTCKFCPGQRRHVTVWLSGGHRQHHLVITKLSPEMRLADRPS